ncbi:hypothetical protein [Micromonospora auratinigra]|uniref:Uncharacterized protein n=1 Tax=Micromonospora auratinigra TaxID=261654 RepID=A0A1A9A4G8_9ACTN|nr:hypothetical protein [Micromonospora auratinigra]SBT51102.1 hypothetical protein GA0070611_5021 [Micromonospora auratinigra]
MSATAPELRMRRPVLRVLGALRPVRAGYRMHPATLLAVLALAAAAFLLLLLFGVPLGLPGVVPFAVGAAIALPYPLLTLGAGAWYACGAGHPMLRVADGEVRGRLRGVWADELADADPTDPSFWDLRLPVGALTGVRVERDRPGSPILVLDVPPEVTAALLADEDTRPLAEHWRDRVGSPAAWQVGLYAGRFRRERRLRALLGALPG